MDNPKIKEIRNLFDKGMKLSGQMLLKKKQELNQKLVISENGIVRIIDAKDLN